MKELRRLIDERVLTWEREVREQHLFSVWKTHANPHYGGLEDEPDCQCQVPYRCTCHDDPLDMYYTQQCYQKWEDGELPTDTVGVQQEKGKSNLKSEDDFQDKIKGYSFSIRF